MAEKQKIPWAKPTLFGNEKEYVLDALNSTWISDGPYVSKFESAFSEIIKIKHTISVSNGTVALNLALLGLGIGPGDEVIVPDFTFVAPGNTVLQVGATPIYVDVDKDTWLISPKAIEKAITPKTKAIIVVHLYGNVCDMNKIMEIAKKNNLFVIEDTAEAAFSKYKEKSAGTFGDIGCFSFQATKTITMGEGGAVVTNGDELNSKMRKIRSHGMTSKRYWHDTIGYNYRITNIQAALGYAQIEKIDFILENKRRVYDSYLKNLKSPGIIFQKIDESINPIIWAIAIRLDPKKFKGDRDFIMQELSKFGIETRPGFYPFSVMPFYKAQKCPVSESISKEIISLPSYTLLKEEEIEYICNCLKSLMR
jgi:perosamine synthetase